MTQDPDSHAPLTIVETTGAVMSVGLDNPRAANAFSPRMRDELIDAFTQAESSPEIGAVVLYGVGRGFCGGGDIRAMGTVTPTEKQRSLGRTAQLIEKMVTLPKPIVGAVHGYAVGAGVSLALACDLVVVESDTTFTIGFRRLGLLPDMGAHHFLSRLVGPWRAKELVWRGGSFDGADAVRWGLASDVVGEGRAVGAAKLLAEELAAGPRTAMAYTKAILARAQIDELKATLELEGFASALLRTTHDHEEGVAAVRARRPPVFGGLPQRGESGPR